MSAQSFPFLGMERARPRRWLTALASAALMLAAPTATTTATPTTAAGTTTVPAVTTAGVGFAVERLAGSNRYATAVELSRKFFAPGVPVAIVSTGANFPDGLSAGPAADQLGGPVLFVTRDSVPSVTRTELGRLRPQRILVVGGSSAVSETVRGELDSLTAGSATRLSGSDRFVTSAAVSRHAFPSGATVAYVATGRAFPDALAAGAAAAVQGGPVLLTDTNTLPPSVRTELQRLNPGRIMLVGGTSSVSETVAGSLAAIAPVERIQGSDRYQTALALSRRVFGPDRPAAFLTTGTQFPDALAASAATRFTRGPIVLTRPTALPTGAATELGRLGPNTAYLLGGTSAVGVPVAKAVQQRLGVCWSGPVYGAGSPAVISQVSGTDTKKVAFTLDMGGRLDPAVGIVNFLIDNQVCTTFFPTSAMSTTTEGRKVMALIKAHPELFEVGNHTAHHCDLVLGGAGSPTTAPCDRSMTSSFIRSELTTAEATLEDLTGMQITPYWRPPYGSHNAFVRENAAAVGYTKTMMWNRDTIDWHLDTTTSQIVSRTTSPLPPSGTIVLAHLGGYRTLDALPQIVSTLRANGYTLTTISDMRDG